MLLQSVSEVQHSVWWISKMLPETYSVWRNILDYLIQPSRWYIFTRVLTCTCSWLLMVIFNGYKKYCITGCRTIMNKRIVLQIFRVFLAVFLFMEQKWKNGGLRGNRLNYNLYQITYCITRYVEERYVHVVSLYSWAWANNYIPHRIMDIIS